ncbi:extracellular mutant protein 11-domain-containing protein [Aspergillus granulosus]|uniref:Extracellular mutant protein 11-domain-containing protein n=1 Tax=Aspergillus granulosus TaxID=176169 RepID=A0ABR4HK80_9EURO
MAFVPSASAFSLPLPLWQQTPSLRVAKYESRKRKKQYETGEDEDDNRNGDDGWTTDAVSDLGATAPSITLPPEEAHQYRIAGLRFDEELPGGHFPHGPVKEKSRGVNNRGSMVKQLSSLSPPIYTPQSAAHQGNIRLHHLAVLTSVLHRCLLDGDYIRAGRAWGLIIREQFGGHTIDVRTEDRWGIGAEILLRKGQQKPTELPESDRVGIGSTGTRDNFPTLLFTRKGFEDAKQYYETLIIQHPYQKTVPNAISALHYYPVMFGLWIYVTQEESKHAQRNLDERDPRSFRETSDDEDDQFDPENHNNQGGRRSVAAGIKANELVEAQKIAARMDEIIVSPPYSDSPELLELRSMVSMWIADLFVSSLPSGGNGREEFGEGNDRKNSSDGDNIFISTERQPDSVQARRERRLAMEKRQTEMEKSQDFMEKARQRKQGSRIPVNLPAFLPASKLAQSNMGVGDYVHSKENRLHQPRANEPSNQPRQALAEQARVEFPATTLIAPVPLSANRQAPTERYGSPFKDPLHGQDENRVHRDAFDTDVEGIDESTIAATSVIGIEEVPYRFSPAPNLTAVIQQLEAQQHPPQPSPSPPRQFRNARRAHDSKWYEALGDKAPKSAGFDLDDADDASQLTSTAGDDELSNDTDDQRYVPRYRATDEPLSGRLQSFWTASRNTYPSTDTAAHGEPSKNPSFIPIASAPKALPASRRKVLLTRSMTTTPRTRFSPPKPSLLEQLDLTPTRSSPGLLKSQSRREREHEKEIIKAVDNHRDPDDGLGLFTAEDTLRPESMQSLNVFDMTNFDDFENDSSMNDPFSRRASMKRVEIDTTQNTKKRHLEPDYPPEILCTKTFAELQAEPFDKTPTPTASKPAPVKEKILQLAPKKGNDEDSISFLLRLSEEERGQYFTKLPMSEWEECGDLLIEHFSKMITKMKDLRHARRKTAALFEAEVKRRNELVEEQSAELSSKFDEMRVGGADVLRGRSP